MAQFTRKQSTVEARQHFGPKLIVMSALKGEQTAHNGDFLIADPTAVQAVRDREVFEGAEPNSYGNKGTVYVVSKDDFLKEFDAVDLTPGTTLQTGFNVPDAMNVNDALGKSSGDGNDAGDWTQAGDGMDYPAPGEQPTTL